MRDGQGDFGASSARERESTINQLELTIMTETIPLREHKTKSPIDLQQVLILVATLQRKESLLISRPPFK